MTEGKNEVRGEKTFIYQKKLYINEYSRCLEASIYIKLEIKIEFSIKDMSFKN